MVAERDLTLGGEHTMWYADDTLQNCTLETCMVLLTNVTPINSIFKKAMDENKKKDRKTCFKVGPQLASENMDFRRVPTIP